MAYFTSFFSLLTPTQWLVAVIGLLQLCIILIGSLRSVSLKRHYQAQIADLQSHLNAVNQGSIGMGKRLIKLERQLAQKNSYMERVAMTKKAPEQKSPAALDEDHVVVSIMKRTGLGRAEAQLLSRIQSGPKLRAM